MEETQKKPLPEGISAYELKEWLIRLGSHPIEPNRKLPPQLCGYGKPLWNQRAGDSQGCR